MADLLMVVPSRGRPQNAERLCEAMDRTCRAKTGLILGLDADDPALEMYPRQEPYVEVWAGLRQVVPWINALAVPRAHQHFAVGHFGDDNVPLTVGWDVAMLEGLQQTPFAYANDLYPRRVGEVACHIFMRSSVIMALGYMGPPSIRHMHVDSVWTSWGDACGMTYRHDVEIEHRHYSNNKAPFDETYKASFERTAADHAAWQSYNKRHLAADIEKIRAITDGH